MKFIKKLVSFFKKNRNGNDDSHNKIIPSPIINMSEKDNLVVSLAMRSNDEDNNYGVFEIIDSLSIPYEVLIGLGYTPKQTGFYLAWWFEALQKALESLCEKPEDICIEFECELQLRYTATVKANSLDEAFDLMCEIPKMVVTNLNEIISLAVKEYKFDALDKELPE